jgi:hypothetical protein
MHRLIVEPQFQDMFRALGLHNLEDTCAPVLAPNTRREKVIVRRVALSTGDDVRCDAFVKLYEVENGWAFALRASKARREFENYAVFQRLGIPAAEAIACQEERGPLGQLKRAFIITRAVPDACGLADFFRSSPSRELRLHVLNELAGIVRRLHAARFYYYDLVWRNILVSHTDPARPRVVLIDCPRGGIARFGRGRRQLRDLASLDKMAAQLCTRTERLRFLLAYLGKARLDDEARALARACLAYRRRRWPEDWRGR